MMSFSYSTSPSGPPTLQRLRSHTWLVAALLEAQLTLDGSSPESLTSETKRLLSPASPSLYLEVSCLFTVSQLLPSPSGNHSGAESGSVVVQRSPAQAPFSAR